MAVLTPNQKECIAAIEREFIAVNQTNTDIPYSVVNVNKLTAEVRRQKISKSELDIHNKGMEVVRKELREKLINKLNVDFKAGDIKLTAQDYGNDIKIILTKNIGSYSSENMQQVYVINLFERHEFGKKVIGFAYSDEWEGREHAIVAQTPEELFANPEMEKRIVRLIHKSTQ
jgi:hypothetical protein